MGVSGNILWFPATHPDLFLALALNGVSHPVVRVAVDAEFVMLVGHSLGTFGQQMTVTAVTGVIIVRFTVRKGGCLEKGSC